LKHQGRGIAGRASMTRLLGTSRVQQRPRWLHTVAFVRAFSPEASGSRTLIPLLLLRPLRPEIKPGRLL
jgi:hypothetical protein